MKPIKLPKDEKEAIISDLQEHMDIEHGLELGHLAAEQLIDYMLGLLTSPIYNQAIEDALTAVRDRMSVLEDDLYAMKATKKSTRR
ncbi:DUF2164 domain-containing protein [Paenibacillus roseipurpureus]|uniref:DUF2164 domain-containing protein n=1 Tax=Paenibacillus roseopurpureus TaxID=2918901 RepID=A0AA96LJG4_9BACL|nr:DUF2164 domain-containing protein [Paenibacillus sp. MBLB1832]WNR42151.1 DUF2164 domain-containing protein [Paenibacillus sp. MBLB1832]